MYRKGWRQITVVTVCLCYSLCGRIKPICRGCSRAIHLIVALSRHRSHNGNRTEEPGQEHEVFSPIIVCESLSSDFLQARKWKGAVLSTITSVAHRLVACIVCRPVSSQSQRDYLILFCTNSLCLFMLLVEPTALQGTQVLECLTSS